MARLMVNVIHADGEKPFRNKRKPRPTWFSSRVHISHHTHSVGLVDSASTRGAHRFDVFVAACTTCECPYCALSRGLLFMFMTLLSSAFGTWSVADRCDMLKIITVGLPCRTSGPVFSSAAHNPGQSTTQPTQTVRSRRL